MRFRNFNGNNLIRALAEFTKIDSIHFQNILLRFGIQSSWQKILVQKFEFIRFDNHKCSSNTVIDTTRSTKTGVRSAKTLTRIFDHSSVNESNDTRNFVVIDKQLHFFDLFEIIYFIAGEVILNMEQTIDTLIEPHDASPTEIIIFKIISCSNCFLLQFTDREGRPLVKKRTSENLQVHSGDGLEWTGS